MFGDGPIDDGGVSYGAPRAVVEVMIEEPTDERLKASSQNLSSSVLTFRASESMYWLDALCRSAEGRRNLEPLFSLRETTTTFAWAAGLGVISKVWSAKLLPRAGSEWSIDVASESTEGRLLNPLAVELRRRCEKLTPRRRGLLALNAAGEEPMIQSELCVDVDAAEA